MDPQTELHVSNAEAEMGIGRALALGFWLDGVPCNYDRSESLECFSMNFPGFHGDFRDLRIPITAINKKFVIKHNTFDDIMDVMVWSLQACALGAYPAARHDGESWLRTDHKRAKKAGAALGVPAVLAEVRGDWAMYNDMFRLPAWNDGGGCCWLCKVKPEDIRDCSSTAPWREASCIILSVESDRTHVYMFLYLFL